MPSTHPEGRPAAALTRRAFAQQTVLSGIALFGAPAVLRGRYRLFGQGAPAYSARTVDLVNASLVADLLCAMTNDPRRAWAQRPATFTAEHLRDFRDSGITLFNHAGGRGPRDQLLLYVARWTSFIADHADDFVRVDSAADLTRLKASGKMGIIIGTQDSIHFNTVDDVTLFHSLGQRISQLTYNSRNLIGNGCEERRDDGLSDFGVAVVERMNAVGMAIDVSHCGDRTSLEGAETSRRPVFITHGNCRALVPGHPRAKSDEVIRAVAKGGGMMGVSALRNLVRAEEPTTIEHVLDHYDYTVKLVGIEHVGIGSDSDLQGWDDTPAEFQRNLRAQYKPWYGFREKMDIEGLDHPKRVYDLTEGLVRRKYSNDQIRLILGENVRRVLTAAWAANAP